MQWRTAKRKGALPPKIILLIAILVIAIIVILSYYILTSVKPSSILWISEAYYLSGKIFLNIRNIGPGDVTISHITVTCQSGGMGSSAETISIPRGSVWSIEIHVSGTIRDKDLCTAQVTLLSPSSSNLNLSFYVITP
ncbi:MAG: hypothetical protein GU347_04915 [Desulfurococcales archaeon]|jgi:hypothetical protein|nr:hypothetical protein [Desulfurococcales archaeon]